MARAFNSKMLTNVERYKMYPGFYNDENDWIEGRWIKSTIPAVIKTGNKFSQFEEGVALISMEGGERFADFRSLYVPAQHLIELADKVGYQGEYYNVLQMSDELTFSFRGYLLEKDKSWTPS